MNKIGRNDPCPCGSGKKYKKCCLPLDETASRSVPPPNDSFASASRRPDVEIAVDRALERIELGAGKEVEAEIKALLRDHPDYHTTNYAMGVFLVTVQKDLAAAIPYFERAIAIFPEFAEAHFNLAVTARTMADLPRSVAAFRAAARFSPGPGEIGKMARHELHVLEKIITKDSTFKTLDAYLANAELFDRAFQTLSDQDFPRAIELFNRVIDAHPNHVQSYGNLALAYASVGQKSRAQACLDRALELDPEYEPAKLNRPLIDALREGESLAPLAIREVRYYQEKFTSENSARTNA